MHEHCFCPGDTDMGVNIVFFNSVLDESAFYKCPDRLRLPLIFYFGHTAAVYINKLVLSGLLKVCVLHDIQVECYL